MLIGDILTILVAIFCLIWLLVFKPSLCYQAWNRARQSFLPGFLNPLWQLWPSILPNKWPVASIMMTCYRTIFFWNVHLNPWLYSPARCRTQKTPLKTSRYHRCSFVELRPMQHPRTGETPMVMVVAYANQVLWKPICPNPCQGRHGTRTNLT